MTWSRTLVIAVTCIATLSCQAARRPPASIVGGCTGEPPYPPPGTVLPTLASNSDSLLVALDSGGLVATARWSNDSLAALSRPENTHFFLRPVRRPREVVGGIPNSLPATIVTAPGDYLLSVRSIGGMPLDTKVSVRRGFRDTVQVRIQVRGIELCY